MKILCNENNLVFVRRNGVYSLMPFCELEEGDYIPQLRSTVGVEAHRSGDASYDGWLLYTEDDKDVYPEDICFWTDDDLFQYVEDVWYDFGAVAMNPETECIEAPWLHFPTGTHREEIWHWFENTFSVRVHDLMYGKGGRKNVDA